MTTGVLFSCGVGSAARKILRGTSPHMVLYDSLPLMSIPNVDTYLSPPFSMGKGGWAGRFSQTHSDARGRYPSWPRETSFSVHFFCNPSPRSLAGTNNDVNLNFEVLGFLNFSSLSTPGPQIKMLLDHQV